jgi:hypothetical protein
MKVRRIVSIFFLGLMAVQGLVSCASDKPKRHERVPPPMTDSTLPWNRPPKWEGNARYGSMMPQSR